MRSLPCKPASPKRDSRLKGCSALKAPPVKASARRRRPAVRSNHANRGKRASTTKPQVACGSGAFLSSPDLGCPQSPANAARIRTEGQRQSRSVRRSSVLTLAECNCRRVFISKRREIANDGSSYRPAASIPPSSRLARCLRAGGRARSEPHGGQRQILRVFPCDTAMDGPAGGARPVAARNGAPICRNAVRRGEYFSGG